MTEQLIRRPCVKCSGTGKIAAFSRIANGDCFDCAGLGYIDTTAAQEARRKAASARRAATRESKAAATIAARMATFKADGYTLEQYHDEHCNCGGFCARTYNDGAMGKAWDAA